MHFPIFFAVGKFAFFPKKFLKAVWRSFNPCWRTGESISFKQGVSIFQSVIGSQFLDHVGSAQTGPKVAAILSVVESCRRIRLPRWGYLAQVLPGLANLSVKRLDNLTLAASVA
jgi:hypothetical protein